MSTSRTSHRTAGCARLPGLLLPRRSALLLLLLLGLLLGYVHLRLGHRLSLPPLPLLLKSPTQGERGQYLVNTPTCQIPNVDPLDPTLRMFITPPKPITCEERPPALTYTDADSVYLLTERQHLYGARPPVTTVSCCTRDISWATDLLISPSHPYDDYRTVRMSPECRPLHGRYTPRHASGVEVTCVLGNTTVYLDYHHFVPLRPSLERSRIQRHPQHVRPSILIFMFDSLSRLQFLRWFPRSRRLLNQRLQAFELGGLNKEGDNTYPNLVAMLTGMASGEMERKCAPDSKHSPLDSCPFIWRDFRRAGYRTAWAEDSASYGAFTYMKGGFIQPPTDYYTRPAYLMSDLYIGHNRMLNTFLCENSRKSYESTFKFAQDLATRFADRPYWALISQTSYTHDFFNFPYFLDEPYHQLLETLLNSGALNNTVLITMGDHGMRWGSARATFIGGLEERLPLMNIHFPAWMRQRYPTAFENLWHNQRRLTSFRDIYATMMSLLRADRELRSVDDREAPANASSVSLFRRVSRMRRCNHVGIPLHYCTCLISEQLPPGDVRAAAAARVVVDTLNKLLLPAPQCARLRLSKVLSAKASHQPFDNLADINRRQMTTVRFLTLPGRARLEATVIVDGRMAELSGAVSRLDRYGHLIWCVKDHTLEKYCHCRQAENATAPPRLPAAAEAGNFSFEDITGVRRTTVTGFH